MTLQQTELFSEGTVRGPALRHWFTSIQPKKFAASGTAPTLAQLTPVSYDSATGNWKIWTADNEIQTLTFDATGGTYTISFDGVAVAAAATYLNTAGDTAAITASLETLPNIQPGDVTVMRGTPAGAITIFTVTFGGQWAHKNVPQMTSTEALTGGSGTLTHATTTAGAGFAIDGFVSEPEGGAYPALLHATLETLHNVGMGGTIHHADIPLPAGEDQTIMDAELMGLRAKGFNITGLANFH